MIAFGRYVLSAGAASVVDFVLVQSLLLSPALRSGMPFAAAICMGALAGMSVNFLLSRHYVFDAGDGSARRQAQRFFLISLSTLLFRVAVAFAMLSLLSLPAFALLAALPIDAPATRLSHIAAMGLVTIYSYLAHKHVSFARGPVFARRLAVR
jgi:putative flippase GtrA